MNRRQFIKQAAATFAVAFVARPTLPESDYRFEAVKAGSNDLFVYFKGKRCGLITQNSTRPDLGMWMMLLHTRSGGLMVFGPFETRKTVMRMFLWAHKKDLSCDERAHCQVCGTSIRDAKIYGVLSGVEMGCSACVGIICSPRRENDQARNSNRRRVLRTGRNVHQDPFQ